MAQLISDDVAHYIALNRAHGSAGHALAIAPADADPEFYAYPCALRSALSVAHTRAH